MKTLSQSWKVMMVVALLVTVAATAHNPVGAQSSQAAVDPALFGMVGIIGGQTARLNVVIPPDAETPSGPAALTLKFVDGSGNLALGGQDCRPNQEHVCSQISVMLGPGQSAYFDLNGDDIVGGGVTRTEIRPVIIWQDPAIIWQKRTISTLEMIDNATSRTTWVYLPPSPCSAGRSF